MKFLTISYFADLNGSNYYRRCAERLITCLRRVHLDCEVEEIPSRGSYRENCIFKPMYILRQLVGFKCPVLWIDVDSMLYRYPEALRELPDNVDLALATPNGNLASAKASPLLFNHSPRSLEFLAAWLDRIEIHSLKKAFSFDHEPMLEVLAELNHQTHVVDVGIDYCRRDQERNGRTVISMGISRSSSKNSALTNMRPQELRPRRR